MWKKQKIHNIKLSGIHLNLLEQQANGLTKHIGSLFNDLSETSAWLGGAGEAWERGPYYLDGLLPLAYLVQDEELIKESEKWLNAILNSQRENGYFGPAKNNDWWPRAVVLKVLVSAYLATNDDRIVPFVLRYFDYFLANIDHQPFDFWGYSRGLEGIEILHLLKDELGNEKYTSILKHLQNNTLDWKYYFEHFPYTEKTDKYMNRRMFKIVKYLVNVIDVIKKKSKRPQKINKSKILKSRNSDNNLVFLKTHGVNIAMALKYLTYIDQDSESMKKGLSEVLKYHGNAIQIFSSDEHLNGVSPSCGVELCNVVEMMYTMEEVLRLTGDCDAADYLEYYAYNALLTTITPDFTAHQYVQQVNQLDCEVKKHPFYDTNKYANTFGVEPNYGCCAANMHQGWPKMVLSSVLVKENTIGLYLYMNGTYRVEIDKQHVVLQVTTCYPFDDVVTIRCIESTVDHEFDLQLRIPYKADAILTYKKDTTYISDRHFITINQLLEKEELTLKFDFKIETIHNQDKTISVRRGPLLFTYPIQYEEFYIKGNKPFHDRGFKAKEDGQYTLITSEQEVVVKKIIKENDDFIFHKNLMKIVVEALSEEENSKSKDIELIPYGLSVLRRTHFMKKEKINESN